MARKKYGVENPNVIDIVSMDPPTGVWTLTMVEWRPWSRDPERFEQLRQKVILYVSYIESGRLVHDYPAAKGHEVELELSCVHSPPVHVREEIERITERLQERCGLTFRCSVMKDQPARK